MKKIPLSIGLLAVSALISGSLSRAEDNMTGTQTGSTNGSMNGSQTGAMTSSNSGITMQDFQKSMVFNKIHHVNQKEITFSKMALDKSTSKDVKDFAQRMIDDHTKADQKVMDLAKSENVDLKTFQMADFEDAASDMMGKTSGAQFDHLFVPAMRMGHHQVLNELQMAQQETQDTQLKALITQLIPTVREHERMAGNLRMGKSMAGTMRSNGNS